MKKVFFTFSLALCLCYVYTRVLAVPPAGVMNEMYNGIVAQNADFYFHGGVDIHWTNTLNWPAGSYSRAVLPAPKGGLIFLYEDILAHTHNPSNKNAGFGICLNPMLTAVTTIYGGQTTVYTRYYEPTQDPLYCGIGHCMFDLHEDIQNANGILTILPGSNLAGLHSGIKAVVLHRCAIVMNNNSDPNDDVAVPDLPLGIYLSNGNYYIPSISQFDPVAIVGDYWWNSSNPPPTSGIIKENHFHVDLYRRTIALSAIPTVTTTTTFTNGTTVTLTITNTVANTIAKAVCNIGMMNEMKDYLKSVIPATVTPVVSDGFIMRPDCADQARWRYPQSFNSMAYSCGANGAGDVYYVPLGTSTATPVFNPDQVGGKSLGFCIDVIQDAYTNWGGWNADCFDNIEYRIYHVVPSPTSSYFMPWPTKLAEAMVYKIPSAVIGDDSYGLTFPPPTQTNRIQYHPNYNGDYGYMFERNPDQIDPPATANPFLPFSWSFNPDTSDNGASTNIFHSYWILSNLHSKTRSDGEFIFNNNHRYFCWNSSVHNRYEDEDDTLAWWLPPKTSLPPPYHTNPAHSPMPSLTNNMAYNPKYAYFPDGTYYVEAEYKDIADHTVTKKSESFMVDNYKPYLKGIAVFQQQMKWDYSTTTWYDPESDDSWWQLNEVTKINYSPWVGVNKILYKQYCLYEAFWENQKDAQGREQGYNVGSDCEMRLKTLNLFFGHANFVDAAKCNFESVPNSARAKRWANGEKAIYFEFDFSESIDPQSFSLDIEDRFNEFRCLLDASHRIADISLPPGLDENSEIFSYFDFTDQSEWGWTFKKGSNAKTVYAKIPALKLFLVPSQNGYTTNALFDAAERRLFIMARDMAGTQLACLEDTTTGGSVTESFNQSICRSASNGHYNENEWGDSWLHRLSIDTTTEAKCWMNPQGFHNWPDVHHQIQNLEDNSTFDDIVNFHINNVSYGKVWTEQYDPKRHIARLSIDGDTIHDSSGTRETRTTIGLYEEKNRNDNAVRIMVGRQIGYWCYMQILEIDCLTVDAAGNYNCAVGQVFPNPGYTTGPWRSFETTPPTIPPSTSFTTEPPVSFYTTFPPTNTLPYTTSVPSLSIGPTGTPNEPEDGIEMPEPTQMPSPLPSIRIAS